MPSPGHLLCPSFPSKKGQGLSKWIPSSRRERFGVLFSWELLSGGRRNPEEAWLPGAVGELWFPGRAVPEACQEEGRSQSDSAVLLHTSVLCSAPPLACLRAFFCMVLSPSPSHTWQLQDQKALGIRQEVLG